MLLFLSAEAANALPDNKNEVLDRLLARIAKRDNEAFAQIYEKTKSAVYAYALSVLKNAADAEDILHDCYLRVFAGASDYTPCGKPMSWILTIAKTLCFMKLRERRKTSELPDENLEEYFGSCPGLSPEDKVVLTECMTLLSDEERKIVALHAVAGFRHREIASFTGLPLPTVLSKYSRAIGKLRKHLAMEE